VRKRCRIQRKAIRSICLDFASNHFLISLQIWEESYLYKDFKLEKSNRLSYREKNFFLGG